MAIEEGSCDRRLSRAARSLLYEKLLMSPSAKSILDNQQQEKSSDERLWYLLDRLLQGPSKEVNRVTASSKCPLLPELDHWQDHERHSAVISAEPTFLKRHSVTGFTASHFFRAYARGDHPYFYQCLFCQKLFSSRYYLDVHQATHHDTSRLSGNVVNQTAITPRVCPGTDWCQFLSPTACHERALQNEPYYGRGSNGRRKDRYKVETKLWKQAHAVPCTTAAASEAHAMCQKVGETCFAQHEQMLEYWHSHICGKETLSCPNRLHQLYFRTRLDEDLLMRQVHEWQEDWIYWSEEHHALGWMGTLVLVILFIYYARVLNRKGQQYLRHRKAPRLLRPKAKRH